MISRFYGYVADGIFQNWDEVYAHTNENGKLVQSNAQPGDIRFKDLNHDGVLDENDKTWIGNPYPDLMVGLNLGFSYKTSISQPTSMVHSVMIFSIRPKVYTPA